MYAITGATGHIGRQLVEELIKRGKRVRAIARHKDHLRPLENKGAEPYVANVEDADAMTRAFEGVEAVFLLIPQIFMLRMFVLFKIGSAKCTPMRFETMVSNTWSI